MTDDPATLRVFVAVCLPDDLKQRLAGVLGDLQSATPPKAVRWAKPEQIHLTLKFLGDVPADHVAGITSALSRASQGVPAFRLQTAGLGCFPNLTAPRVVWVGMDGDLDRLSRLHESVRRETEAWGKPEHREFHPHLTLGRVKTSRRAELRSVGEAAKNLVAPPPGVFPVGEVHLMRSELSAEGATYSSLAHIGLEA